MQTIMFKRHVTFTGRNGTFKCAGVEITEFGSTARGRVQISPITSKGTTGRCDIDIPVESLAEVIAALQGYVLAPASYDETPHEAGCAKRVHGAAECDCVKADMDPDA